VSDNVKAISKDENRGLSGLLNRNMLDPEKDSSPITVTSSQKRTNAAMAIMSITEVLNAQLDGMEPDTQKVVLDTVFMLRSQTGEFKYPIRIAVVNGDEKKEKGYFVNSALPFTGEA